MLDKIKTNYFAACLVWTKPPLEAIDISVSLSPSRPKTLWDCATSLPFVLWLLATIEPVSEVQDLTTRWVINILTRHIRINGYLSMIFQRYLLCKQGQYHFYVPYIEEVLFRMPISRLSHFYLNVYCPHYNAVGKFWTVLFYPQLLRIN